MVDYLEHAARFRVQLHHNGSTEWDNPVRCSEWGQWLRLGQEYHSLPSSCEGSVSRPNEAMDFEAVWHFSRCCEPDNLQAAGVFTWFVGVAGQLHHANATVAWPQVHHFAFNVTHTQDGSAHVLSASATNVADHPVFLRAGNGRGNWHFDLTYPDGVQAGPFTYTQLVQDTILGPGYSYNKTLVVGPHQPGYGRGGAFLDGTYTWVPAFVSGGTLFSDTVQFEHP